jgi:hypothetical protein
LLEHGGRFIGKNFFGILMPAVLFIPAFGETSAEDWFQKGIALCNQGKYDVEGFN